jgi:hypothetical protein
MLANLNRNNILKIAMLGTIRTKGKRMVLPLIGTSPRSKEPEKHFSDKQHQTNPTWLLAAIGLAILLTAASFITTPQAFANHTQRAEWEIHGNANNIGGLKASIKVQNPTITSCGNLALPCTHTMVVAYQAVAGFMAAGWLKYKDAGGNGQVRGLAYWKDYQTGASTYVLGEPLAYPTTQSFQAKKSNYDANSSCWIGVTPGFNYNKCMSNFKWGHPRVMGRLNDNLLTFGTTVGTFTSVQNRAQTSETWVNMGGSGEVLSYCKDTTYAKIHSHQVTSGYNAFHIGPPFTGETDNCSGLQAPDDIGG